MKKKIRLSGNRTVIGIICIILALIITFGIAPVVNHISDQKVNVVQMKTNVERGHLITEDDVELVMVGSYNLSEKTVKDTGEVIGQYAATNLYSGQMVLSSQLTGGGNSADEVLNSVGGDKVAISVNIGSYAMGLSDKIGNGDIVSVIIYDKDENKSYIPPELKYVKVITTTTGDGVDHDEKTDGSEQAATITLLATPAQAELLAQYNSVTTLHFALVCRGDKAIAEDYLKAQDTYLSSARGNTDE